jgi:hypothetical protein
MTASTSPRPRTFLRRVERKLMGAVMWVIAFILEKIIMRSVKKEGKTHIRDEHEPTTLKATGGEVDFPER